MIGRLPDLREMTAEIKRNGLSTENLSLPADDVLGPNGLCFSPGEETLYVTDTDGVHGEGVYTPSKPASEKG